MSNDMTFAPTSDLTRDTWHLVHNPSGIIEVRALLDEPARTAAWEGWGAVISGYFDNEDAFAESIKRLDASKQVKAIYVTLNPVASALKGRAHNRLVAAGKKTPTTSDDDIVSRQLLFIDADPFRPAGISSTQAEMEAALAKRDQVVSWLHAQGFPAFIEGMSGNGGHALGVIDLPNSEASTKLVSDFLECLNQKFGTVPSDSTEAKRQFNQGIINVSIDTTVFNASRITKLYGTMVRKGDDTEDRPHRRSMLTYIPEHREIIPAELLERVAQEYCEFKAQQAQPTNHRNFSASGYKSAADWSRTADGVEQWLQIHRITLGNRETYTSDGFQYKWDVDCLTCGGAHTDGAAIMWGANKGLGYKCHHNSCKGKGWAEVRSIVAPKVYPNGHTNQAAKRTMDEVIDTSDLQLSTDEVIAAIVAITDDTSLKPEERKGKLVKELGDAIGGIERSDHALVLDYLATDKTGFTKTEASAFIKACAAKARKKRKEQLNADAQARKKKQREDTLSARAEHTIIVGDRQLKDVRVEVMAALVDMVNANPQDPPLYVKVGALSRIVCDENGIYGAQEVKLGAMPGILSDAATWVTIHETDKTYRELSVFPPRDVATDILNQSKWLGIPALTAIANAPVFGRDGTLHSEPGYNAATGLYYTGGVSLGDTTPTPERIGWAKNILLVELLGDFPFKDDASKVHALAYGMNPFIREMVRGPIPPTGIDAPTEGTGKSLLQNSLAYLFLGHDAPTMADTEDDEEWRKRITSKLLSGATHATIDNVRRELDSGVLANAWTQPIWDDRTLGVNRDVKIPNRMVWAITANNMQLSRENTRRVVWCRLDANMERPHLRDTKSFRHPDLKSWVVENRDELVTAIITMIRAWINAGKPRYEGRTKGSFESWTHIMGGIFQVVDIPGFLGNEDELFGHAVTDADEMGDFIDEWWNKYGNAEVGLNRHLFKLASVSDNDSENSSGEYLDLLKAKLTSNKQRGRQQQLGRLLDDAKGRVYRGFKVAYVRLLRGEKMYRLEDHRSVVEVTL